MCKRRLWKWASLSTVNPLGNLGGGSFTGDSERQMEESSGNGASLYGSSVRGTWRGGCFIWDPEGFVKESSQNGPHQRGPVGEAGGGLIYWGP